MSQAGGPPGLLLSRLRCSGTDLVRSLLERKPAWGHVGPAHQRIDGDRAAACYRLEAHSFWLEVQWRRQQDQWIEHDFVVVPGSAVALRLVLDDLHPDRVTRALGLQPSRAWQKGAGGGRRIGASARRGSGSTKCCRAGSTGPRRRSRSCSAC
jgi:hypothetical protein